VNSQFL